MNYWMLPKPCDTSTMAPAPPPPTYLQAQQAKSAKAMVKQQQIKQFQGLQICFPYVLHFVGVAAVAGSLFVF